MIRVEWRENSHTCVKLWTNNKGLLQGVGPWSARPLGWLEPHPWPMVVMMVVFSLELLLSLPLLPAPVDPSGSRVLSCFLTSVHLQGFVYSCHPLPPALSCCVFGMEIEDVRSLEPDLDAAQGFPFPGHVNLKFLRPFLLPLVTVPAS